MEKPFGKGNRADWRTDDSQKKNKKNKKAESSCSQVITGNAVNRSSKEDSWEEGVLFFIVSKSVL